MSSNSDRSAIAYVAVALALAFLIFTVVIAPAVLSWAERVAR